MNDTKFCMNGDSLREADCETDRAPVAVRSFVDPPILYSDTHVIFDPISKRNCIVQKSVTDHLSNLRKAFAQAASSAH